MVYCDWFCPRSKKQRREKSLFQRDKSLIAGHCLGKTVSGYCPSISSNRFLSATHAWCVHFRYIPYWSFQAHLVWLYKQIYKYDTIVQLFDSSKPDVKTIHLQCSVFHWTTINRLEKCKQKSKSRDLINEAFKPLLKFLTTFWVRFVNLWWCLILNWRLSKPIVP